MRAHFTRAALATTVLGIAGCDDFTGRQIDTIDLEYEIEGAREDPSNTWFVSGIVLESLASEPYSNVEGRVVAFLENGERAHRMFLVGCIDPMGRWELAFEEPIRNARVVEFYISADQGHGSETLDLSRR
jgi:hypothetical protein